MIARATFRSAHQIAMGQMRTSLDVLSIRSAYIISGQSWMATEGPIDSHSSIRRHDLTKPSKGRTYSAIPQHVDCVDALTSRCF